jgi:hypothetical protein
LSVPLAWPAKLAVAGQIRITLRAAAAASPTAPIRIRHIALYPPAAKPALR